MGCSGLRRRSSSCGVDPRQRVRHLHVAHHDGQRLVGPVLPHAQRGDRVARCCVTRQVVAAESLEGDDGGVSQSVLRGRKGVVGAGDDAVGTVEPQMRAAGRTGHGLGVETTIRRVVVLDRTGLAQRKAVHGRVRTVVGEPARDGEAGTAVGAVDEGVTPAAVAGIEHLGHALAAHGDIRRHERTRCTECVALGDAKPGLVPRRDRCGLDAEDPGQRWRLVAEARREPFEGGPVAFDLYEDPIPVVAHTAGEAETAGQAVHEGTKTDALDDATHPDPLTNIGGGQRRHACCVLRRPRVTAASRCIRPKL